MRVFHDANRIPPDAKGAVVAIGNFDGVHLGHHQVIGEARRIARSLGAPLAVLTFDPHPRRFFHKDGPALQITSFPQKLELLRGLGVALVFALCFDSGMAALSAGGFVSRILVDGLAVRQVIVGHDFRFGAMRGGDTAFLHLAGAASGFGVAVVPARTEGGFVCSSTRIRDALRAGDLETAHRMLGRPWAVRGPLEPHVAGSRAGVTLRLNAYTTLGAGWYATRLSIGGTTRRVAALVRSRDDVEATGLELEVPGASGLCGQMADIALLDYLPPPSGDLLALSRTPHPVRSQGGAQSSC
jgi:riboflavin kinase/FMN adenylyltransferase